MRREPSLTFEGALRILGQHEHKTIEKIDKLLGGVILGGGAVAGAVALGVTPLGPLAAFGVVWGWIEQKELALDLLKSAIDAVSGRVSGLRGYERRELIAAAHSTIVVASFFESFRDHVGKEFYGRLKITDEDRISLIDQMAPFARDESVRLLYAAEIPAPSATCGFEENMAHVARWQRQYSEYLQVFLRGLRNIAGPEDRWPEISRNQNRWSPILKSAVEGYRSRYLELAAKVPEFAIWAQLGEHAATRTSVREAHDELRGDIEGLGATLRELNADVVAGLNANRDALNRVAALLSAGTHGTSSDGGAMAGDPGLGGLSILRYAVSRANAGILDERIIPADRERNPIGLDIPRVSEIYINPRYRVAKFGDRAYPADERWWDGSASRDDFDVFLARCVTSPDATRRPLLLLGHPGAGKSLLTKVLAARLPTSDYTVVWVPLRRVSADADIHHQIEEALDIATHQRIAWSDLAEQSAAAGTVRVVLLDGLDELLQASEHDRSRYLEDVMDFQEREAMQRRPAVVLVTSRTVVADRVRIPNGTTIVKLDPFNDDDIADWLGRWERVNANAISAGTMGRLTLGAVRRQPELAEQPLLLLMLALYAADPELPQLDDDMVTAELYRRLLDGFARREAGKDLGLGHDPSADQLERRAQGHLDRLAVAALGMFNRGRQDIGEEELGKDLEALEPLLMGRSRPSEAGQRIIGEFFFVHAPEAHTSTSQQARNGRPQRAYEFLHATFGEYLVARRVMDELVDVTAGAFSKRRGPVDPDDDLLFALLSHQVLAVRRSMFDFAREIFDDLDDRVRPLVLETLEVLFRTYRNRHGSDRYAAYRPVPPDQVRQLACYSANLIALRIMLEPGPSGIPLTELLGVPESSIAVIEDWEVTPLLWKSCLDIDGLQAMLTLLEMSGSPPILYASKIALSREPLELTLARLIDDVGTAKRLVYGTKIFDQAARYIEFDPWAESMCSWLIPAIAGFGALPQVLPPPPEGTREVEIIEVAELIFRYLRSSCNDKPGCQRMLQLLFKMPPVFKMDEVALTAAAIGRPELRKTIPELQNFELYGRYSEVVRRAELTNTSDRIYYDRMSTNTYRNKISDFTAYAIKEIIRKPLDVRKGELPAASPGLGRVPGAEGFGG